MEEVRLGEVARGNIISSPKREKINNIHRDNREVVLVCFVTANLPLLCLSIITIPLFCEEPFNSARATLAGIELSHRLRKGQYPDSRKTAPWEYFYSLTEWLGPGSVDFLICSEFCNGTVFVGRFRQSNHQALDQPKAHIC